MTKRILFIDNVAPKPYDPFVLENEPLGGTEATVIRIAEGLAKLPSYRVRVQQHNRVIPETFGAEYVLPGELDFDPTHVILLRVPAPIYEIRKRYPKAKLYLWFHDMFSGGQEFVTDCIQMQKAEASAICVSDFHRQCFQSHAGAAGYAGKIRSVRIYNPIDDSLKPDNTPVDKDKIVFFSSPHKGLKHTLELFSRFSDFPELKNMRLYIANPGYYASHDTAGIPNVMNLGALTHVQVIKEVRSALCVLHFNRVFPETFGLVHAECNAVGTPFLTGNLGASRELADHPHECMQLDDVRAVIERLIQWRTKGRPPVRANPYFRLSKCVLNWSALLT